MNEQHSAGTTEGHTECSHTPGPWVLIDGQIGVYSKPLHRVSTHKDEPYHEGLVALVYGHHADNGSYSSESNRNLVAAAPDLLALAKQYASECARCGGTGLITIHFPGNEGVPAWDADNQPCNECDDIRKVIAKAEGRS